MILIVVDVQKGITNDKLFCFELFKENVRLLIHVARENDIEVIFVRHDDGVGEILTRGKDEFEIADEFKPQDRERIFDKNVNSPFKESGLLEYLKSKDTKEIIVVGLQTEYCIDATVQSAFEYGFDVYLPFFTNTTTDNLYMSGEESYHYYNDFIWKDRYAKCLSIEDMICKMRES